MMAPPSSSKDSNHHHHDADPNPHNNGSCSNGYNGGGGGKSYYSSGNTELAKETPVTLRRLEARRKLTRNSTRLVIVLVGLPARGKSFISRKLLHFLNWTGVKCKIFNVGKYRREAYASILQQQQQQQANDERAQKGACDANFFDAHNEQAQALRERVAEIALQDMLAWLDYEEDESGTFDEEAFVNQQHQSTQFSTSSSSSSPPDMSRHSSFSSQHGPRINYRNYERIAIFDATNSTNKRRQWILEECTSPEKRGPGKVTGVVFVESLCDDQELLEENYRYKVRSSPDFEGMNQQEAIQDLRNRVKKYEEQYETITDDSLSYIKVFNLSTKLLVNHIYGRMAKELVPALMAWHIGTRPVFLCRPGQTISGITTDGEDYVARNKTHIDPSDPRFLDMSLKTKKKSMRGDSLGPMGKRFCEELLEFCYDESHSFMFKRASVHDMAFTGTSISGLVPCPSKYRTNVLNAQAYHLQQQQQQQQLQDPPPGPCDSDKIRAPDTVRDPFPLRILTSTMPRAVDTVSWDEYEFQIHQISNLNPLDKGDFNGLELDEIKNINPDWYEKLERDPYGTRFPGGECYQDLIRRLTTVVIDVEQQVVPTLVVSHVSILQCLMAYFRNTPVEQCMSIEVPMHTVIKFEPVRGGGWLESQHPLCGPSTPTGDNMAESVGPPLSERECSQWSLGGVGNSTTGVPRNSFIRSASATSPIWGDQHQTVSSPRAVSQGNK